MGGRGASSISKQSRSKNGLEAHSETNNRISLNVEDYKGIKGDDIRNFFAEQDYEISALFNEKDEVIYIESQFKRDSVTDNEDGQRSALKKDGGNKFKDFHNHPTGEDTIQIFSPADIDTYVSAISSKGIKDLKPTTFMLQTQQGSKFTLEYTGKKTSKFARTANFAKHYNKEFEKQASKSRNANLLSRTMIEWLKINSHKYGFEFAESSFVPFY